MSGKAAFIIAYSSYKVLLLCILYVSTHYRNRHLCFRHLGSELVNLCYFHEWITRLCLFSSINWNERSESVRDDLNNSLIHALTRLEQFFIVRGGYLPTVELKQNVERHLIVCQRWRKCLFTSTPACVQHCEQIR